jgi:hypothetical protein
MSAADSDAPLGAFFRFNFQTATDLYILPRASGEGGPSCAARWWKGRWTRHFVVVERVSSSQTPLPPRKSAVPLPRFHGGGCNASLRTDKRTKERRRTKENEGSGTPTDAGETVRTSGCGARHGWIGLRRPSAAGALACRRSTDGSALKSLPSPGATSGHASWDAELAPILSRSLCQGSTGAVCAGVTRLHLSQSSEHLAAWSVVPGR